LCYPESMKNNFHTHTARCGHAIGSDEDYVKAAIDGGFEILGFSDHIPYPGYFRQGERMHEEELEDYYQSVQALKIKYQDQIKIMMGLEVEFHPQRDPEYLNFIKEQLERCDYLLCGQHDTDFGGTDFARGGNDEELRQYLQDVEVALSSGMIAYLAHPDYFMITRPNWGPLEDEIGEGIVALAKKYQIPLELNLNGVRYHKRHYPQGDFYPYPFPAFWQKVARENCAVVLGYDVHDPELLRDQKREALILDQLQGLKLNILRDWIPAKKRPA